MQDMMQMVKEFHVKDIMNAFMLVCALPCGVAPILLPDDDDFK